MKRCRIVDCDEWRSLDRDWAHEDLCTYHAKVKAGLIDVDDVAIRRALGITRTGPTKLVHKLRGIGPEAVLTDEELELLDLLRSTTEITRRGA